MARARVRITQQRDGLMARETGDAGRFVVGTGRCGSTLLSNMLARYPRLVILNEFFATFDRTALLDRNPVGGERFAQRLLETRSAFELLRSRRRLLEQASAQAMINRRLPPFLMADQPVAFLPLALTRVARAMHLDASLLTARAVRFLKALPEQAPSAHYLALFHWLATQSASTAGWCERSGVSLESLGAMAEAFPQARFVHLHRDGSTTALSMHAHPVFTLEISLRLKPLTAHEVALAAAPPVDGSDPVVRRLTTEAPSVEDCGRYWSEVVVAGMQAVARLGDRCLDVRCEELVADPRGTLERIARFLRLDANQPWLREAAALADPTMVVGRLPHLAPQTRAALEEACLPGQRALGRA